MLNDEVRTSQISAAPPAAAAEEEKEAAAAAGESFPKSTREKISDLYREAKQRVMLRAVVRTTKHNDETTDERTATPPESKRGDQVEYSMEGRSDYVTHTAMREGKILSNKNETAQQQQQLRKRAAFEWVNEEHTPRQDHTNDNHQHHDNLAEQFVSDLQEGLEDAKEYNKKRHVVEKVKYYAVESYHLLVELEHEHRVLERTMRIIETSAKFVGDKLQECNKRDTTTT